MVATVRLTLAKKIIQYRSQHRQKHHRYDPQYLFLRVLVALDNIDNHNDINNEDNYGNQSGHFSYLLKRIQTVSRQSSVMSICYHILYRALVFPYSIIPFTFRVLLFYGSGHEISHKPQNRKI
jgi:hypothetical protein